MQKEEWLEAFEAIHGREPRPEEILTAKASGDFEESSPQSQIEEHIPKVSSDTKKQGFCQFCGQPLGSKRDSCANCYSDSTKGKHKRRIIYRQNNLFAYLSYCTSKLKLSIVIYFVCMCLLAFMLIGGIFQDSTVSDASLNIGAGILAVLIVVLTTMFSISRFGQSILCRIVGARKIERQEHYQSLGLPIEQLISHARSEGLKLPKKIDIYVISNDYPIAYAVGMNKLVVSENLSDYPELLKSKILFELHRIHDMAPNLMLVVVGANIIATLVALVALLFSGFNKEYGSRRRRWGGGSEAGDAAIYFYIILVVVALYLSIVYLIMRRAVRKDVFRADKFMARMNLGREHCFYLDNVTDHDDSWAKTILERGFPNVNSRISKLQKLGVRYSKA